MRMLRIPCTGANGLRKVSLSSRTDWFPKAFAVSRCVLCAPPLRTTAIPSSGATVSSAGNRCILSPNLRFVAKVRTGSTVFRGLILAGTLPFQISFQYLRLLIRQPSRKFAATSYSSILRDEIALTHLHSWLLTRRARSFLYFIVNS
eukprot:1488029-Pleurochrysis_carterae.AAC.2